MRYFSTNNITTTLQSLVFNIVFLPLEYSSYFNRKKSIISVSQTNQSNKRYFEIKSGNLFLTKKRKKNNYYQVNGNFFFATPSFLKKYKSFYYKEKTFPVIIKNKPMSIDIDTLKDFKKVEKFLDLR